MTSSSNLFRVADVRKRVLHVLALPYVTLPIVTLVVLLLITDFSVHMTTGDSITTSRVAFAGDVFADVGLIGQRFKPAFYSPAWTTDLHQFYTHFPALPYYYGWIVAEVSPWPWLTIVTGYLLIAAGVMAAWIYVAAAMLSRAFAWLVGLVMIVLVPTFALLPYNAKSWADLFLALTAAVAVRAIAGSTDEIRVSHRQWGLLAAFGFGVALSSYEYIPAVVFITAGLALAGVVGRTGLSRRDRVRAAWDASVRLGAPVVIGVLVAMAFHMATNLWALESIDALLDDIRNAAAVRTNGGTFRATFPNVGAFLTWLDDQIYATYWLSWIWVVLVVAAVIRVGQVARERKLLSLGVLVSSAWIGFLAFNLIMRQWTWVHFGLVGARHFLVPAAFTFAAGIYTIVCGLKTTEIRRVQRPIASLLIVAVALVVGLGLVRNIETTNDFLASADELPMTDIVDDLRVVLAAAADLEGTHVLTDDNNIARASFLHLPRDYFDLAPPLAEAFPRDAWSYVLRTAGRDSGCGEAASCVLVLTEVLADTAFRDRVCGAAECRFHGRWTIVELEAAV